MRTRKCTSVHAYVNSYVTMCVDAYVNAYVNTYVTVDPANVRAYVNAYVYAYLHAYIYVIANACIRMHAIACNTACIDAYDPRVKSRAHYCGY